MESCSGTNLIISKEIIQDKLVENGNDVNKAIKSLREDIEESMPNSVIMLDESIGVIAEKNKSGNYEYLMPLENLFRILESS